MLHSTCCRLQNFCLRVCSILFILSLLIPPLPRRHLFLEIHSDGAVCRYTNGSVLIAALSPSFIILHTLTTTSLQPSPIATLAWHASSSRQKSDMLATQTRDGDLRVWSVPKSLDAEEGARVVRILKKPDSNRKGDNWMGWSRNGRIVQYSEG